MRHAVGMGVTVEFVLVTIVALIPGVTWWRVFMAPDERARDKALREASFTMVIIIAVLWLVVVLDMARAP